MERWKRLWLAGVFWGVLVGGCAAPGRHSPRREGEEALQPYIGRRCREDFLHRWGPPKEREKTNAGETIVWDLPDGSGRQLWWLYFDPDGVLLRGEVHRFGGVVTYGQCTW